MTTQRLARLCAWILVGFLLVILAQDLARDDVSAVEHWISHLSLGAWGWLNIVNLVVGGLALLGLAPLVKLHAASRWPGRWVSLSGLGLILAGCFVSDAPPGTRYDDAVTWHGAVHEAAGGLTFLGLFAACLTSRRLMSRRWGLVCAVVIAVAFVGASVMAGVNYAGDSAHLPSGVAERTAMFVGIGWLVTLTHHLVGITSTKSHT